MRCCSNILRLVPECLIPTQWCWDETVTSSVETSAQSVSCCCFTTATIVAGFQDVLVIMQHSPQKSNQSWDHGPFSAICAKQIKKICSSTNKITTSSLHSHQKTQPIQSIDGLMEELISILNSPTVWHEWYHELSDVTIYTEIHCRMQKVKQLNGMSPLRPLGVTVQQEHSVSSGSVT